jgi:DNA-binding transcriptional MerR regulator
MTSAVDQPRVAADLAPASADSAETFGIRDLVRECGVTARTVRFYEEKGLLTPRRRGQDRLYSRRDRARLKYVLMGKGVGFTLDEIREMLDLYDLGDGQTTQLKVAEHRFRERIAQLEQQKAEIERMIHELTYASEAASRMLRSAEPGTKPRIRMKAVRANADEPVRRD